MAGAPRTRRLGTYLPALRRQRRDLPRGLGQAIDLALRPRPGERGTIDELRAALEQATNEVADEPGVVEGASLWRRKPPAPDAPQEEPEEASQERPPGPQWAPRALAGATAAILAAWIVANLLPHPPLTPAAAALCAGLLVATLPRIGWLATSGATVSLLALQHRPGAALLIAIPMVAPTLPLARAPSSWPLPAIAAGLGVVGLAGAWPALAAHAKTASTRAVLGAGGWIWIQLIAPLAGKSLYTRSAASHWTHSLAATVSHTLSPLLTARQLALALIWAAAAALLPLIRLRRPAAADIVAIATWAIVLTVATTIAGPPILPGEAILGAIAAVALTLAPDFTNRLRQPTESGDLRSMELR
jgi:hypothetical protein